MTNISTGNINGRVSNRKFKKLKDEEEQCDLQFKMDAYNAGLIFGSDKELVATRLNQQQQRKMLVNWKNLESERLERLRDLKNNQVIMETRSQALDKLKRQFCTHLEPKHYNELMWLYQQGKLKPAKSEGLRVNSAKLISEKARQLQMSSYDDRRPIRNSKSSRSVSSRLNDYNFGIKKSIPTIIISNVKNSYADNLKMDANGHITRIIETDGWKKTIPLILENRIPNAVSIKNSEILSKTPIQNVYENDKNDKIHHLNINFQALGAEFNSQFSGQSRKHLSDNYISSYTPQTNFRLKSKYRSLSAHPKYRTISSQKITGKDEESDEILSKKIDLFCRSISALK